MNKEQIKYLEDAGIYKRWHDKKLDDFTKNEEVLRTIKKYLKNSKDAYEDGIGFYLHGPNGVGKTHILMTSFKELIDKRFTVRVISLTTLIGLFTGSFYNEEKQEQLMTVMKRVNFLGIEEIGKQINSEKSKDMVTHILETVIRYRVQCKKPTWFTSNMKPSAMAEIYNEDIASMLRECSVHLLVDGEDERRTILQKNKKKYL